MSGNTNAERKEAQPDSWAHNAQMARRPGLLHEIYGDITAKSDDTSNDNISGGDII